ncbi:MAG: hypothetical protein PWP65_1479 [Clostridia bacterium]|nr:hypothetical protein [Clostridia bacterium]
MHRKKGIRENLLSTAWLRFLAQAGFALFIAFVAYRHEVVAGQIPTQIVPSPEAYCPFGGVETLYTYITTGKFIKRTHLSNVVVLIALLATTLFAKSAFCGWICPFGTLQEWLRKAGKKIGHLAPFKSLQAWARRRAGWLRDLDDWARYFKYVVLVWILWGTIAYGIMIFRDYDPYAALIRITEIELGAAAVILAIVLVLSFFIDRPWCRYACPLGAIIGLIGKISLVKIARRKELCTQCGLCNRKCPMSIDVKNAGIISNADCNNCLNCLEVCPANALDLYLTFPVPGPVVKSINEGRGL